MKHTLLLFGHFSIPFFNYDLITPLTPILSLRKPEVFFILGVIFLLIMLSLRKANKTELLDTTSTDQIRGLAIIGIILLHYMTNTPVITIPPLYSEYFSPLGLIGVGCFLFLSGFGLTVSYLKQGIYKHYLPKRFIRILLPYWVVSILIILLDLLLLHTIIPVKYIALNLAGIIIFVDSAKNIDVVLWYVTYILLLYVTFYLIFIQKLSDRVKVCILFLVAMLSVFVFAYLQNRAYTYTQYWAIYSLYFPMGAVLGLNFEAIKKKVQKIPLRDMKIIVLTALLVLFLYGYLVEFRTPDLLHILNTYLSGLIFVFAIVLLSLFKLYSKFLLFIGSISYELYLVHQPFQEKFDFLLFRQPYYVSFFLYFAFIVLLAYLLNRLVTARLSTKITRLLFSH